MAKASGGRKKEVVMLWALVPAKLGAEAKRRLAPGLDVRRRRVLARAMLVDVLAALRASPSIDGVAVVGRGAPLDALAAELGVTAVAERTASSLNEAVAEGLEACVARGAVAVLVAMADLPLLRVDDVERMVAVSRDTEVAVAVSRDGTGTNLMLLRPPGAIATAFGTGAWPCTAPRRGPPAGPSRRTTFPEPRSTWTRPKTWHCCARAPYSRVRAATPSAASLLLLQFHRLPTAAEVALPGLRDDELRVALSAQVDLSDLRRHFQLLPGTCAGHPAVRRSAGG